jgi:hypothetical protein
VVLSRRVDDGAVLSQRRRRGRPGDEYVAQQSARSSAAEYVAREVPTSSRPSGAALSPDDAAVILECQVDVAQPLRSVGSMAPRPVTDGPDATRRVPSEAPPPAALLTPTADVSTAKATDDDFMADMQSILTGQKVFDPVNKKTVDKTSLHEPTPAGGGASAAAAPAGKNPQAIFDLIAQNMSYANVYNLGSIDLENRFADFDAIAEAEKSAAKKRPAPAAAAAVPAGRLVDNEDFINDLDAIRTYGAAKPSATLPATSVAKAQSAPAPYSQPLFDTGEHVQTAGDLYSGRLHVGAAPGVEFSYGQIIAMADVFESVDQMMQARPAELTRLKALIEQSTAHYLSGGPDVTTEDWQNATARRYLKLAENNYEHFSLDAIAGPRGGAAARGRYGDNKSAWERHHRDAIGAAQELFAANPAQSSLFPERPLIINAFGDHFLTDAFAAGHLVNKEAMIARFKANFLSGSSLTSSGKQFFAKVARKSFVGDVARKFSATETANYPVCAAGWCFMWHPNIDSWSTFSTLLMRAAEQEPDRIANLAVKALHDYLNRTGIEVTNEAGDRPWTLMGDTHMDARTLAVARRAVQQSVDNINDPSIFASNLDFAPYFSRVWRHVPTLTDPSRQTLVTLLASYTSPNSDALMDAAAAVIQSEADAMIQTLVDEGKLKAA